MQKKKGYQKQGQREKCFILLVDTVLISFSLYLNMCNYEHNWYLPGYVALSTRQRLSHSLDNLKWLVRFRGRFIDEVFFGHPQLCMARMERKWLKISYRFHGFMHSVCPLLTFFPISMYYSSHNRRWALKTSLSGFQCDCFCIRWTLGCGRRERKVTVWVSGVTINTQPFTAWAIRCEHVLAFSLA